MSNDNTAQAHETIAQLRSRPAAEGTYVEALRGAALFSGPVAAAIDFAAAQRRPLLRRRSLSSVYLNRSGGVHVIRPHSHIETAKGILRALHPSFTESRAPNPQQVLSLLSGLIRAQIYNDGIGVSLEMAHPPSAAQLAAIRDLHDLAGGGTLVVEVLSEGKLLGHVQSLAGLDAFVSAVHLGEAETMPPTPDELTRLLDRLSHDGG
jgi:hypothetical protein